jgi:surfactin synthase thioesterase subunit
MPVPDGWDWFGKQVRQARARVSLFCLPFSGGGASSYRAWRGLFPAEIEVCPVQLPGREERIEEPHWLSPAEIARALADRIDLPFALYGHSMGARLGFEILRSLQNMGVPAPVRFYPAACSPPHMRDTVADYVDLPDEQFLDTLVRRLGAPEELRDVPELRRLLLPTLRADLGWCHRYRYYPGQNLATTIVALAGETDTEVTPGKMAGWSRHGERFKLLMVPGGHFFLRTAAPRLTSMIREDLLGALAGPEPSSPADAATCSETR